MRKRLWLAATVAALALAGAPAWGADVNVGDAGTSPTNSAGFPTDTSGGDTYVFIEDGTLNGPFATNDVSIDDSTSLNFGADQAGSAGLQMDIELNDITTAGTASELNIVSAGSDASLGTSVTVNELDLTLGGIVSVGASADDATGQNKLIVSTLTASGAVATTITVGQDSLLQVANNTTLGGTGATDINLNGGTANFVDGVTLANGTISGGGTITGAVTLDGTNSNITVDTTAAAGPLTQTYTDAVVIGGAGAGTVTVTGSANGAATADFQAGLTLGGDSGAATVTISGNAAGTGGLLKTTTLAFGDTASTITINAFGTLQVTDTQLTVIDNGHSIALAAAASATADFSTGGVQLTGGGGITGDGTVALGTGSGLDLSTGGLLGSAGGSIIVTGASTITTSGDGTGTFTGTITAADATMHVTGGSAIAAATTVTVKNVTSAVTGDMTATITGAAATGKLVVTDSAAFAGTDTTNNLVVSANLDLHQAGSFGDNSAFVSTTTANTITLGDAALNSTLTLNGGALDALVNNQAITIAESTTGTATLAVTGTGSEIRGDVNVGTDIATNITGAVAIYGGATGLSVDALAVNSGGAVTLGETGGPTAGIITAAVGDLVFASGSALTIAADSGITTTAATQMLDMQSGSTLNLGTSALAVTTGAVQLYGTLTVDGVDNGAGGIATGTLTATTVDIGADFIITMGTGLSDAINSLSGVITDQVLIDATITSQGASTGTWSQTVANLYGDYGFTANLGVDYASGGGILMNVAEVVDVTNIKAVQNRLNRMYPDSPISYGFAATMVGIIANNRDWDPAGTSDINSGVGIFVDNTAGTRVAQSGYNHYHYFLAAADKDMNAGVNSTWQIRDSAGNATGGVGTVDDAMMALYNGYAGTTTAQIAFDTVFETINTMDEHIFAVNQANRDLVESGVSYPSIVLNEQYLNRFWVGGLGHWADADRRHNFAGYKYDGGGFITGYDRAVGPMTVGGAFSYMKGDYEDKSANANDSDIESYGFNLYASYMHRAGFFATALGGYTLSKNDLSDSRGGGTARQKFDTDTWNIGAKIGYDLRLSHAFALTPSVGLMYVHAENERHNVNWGGVSDFLYGKAKLHSAVLPVDVRAGYDIMFNECSKLNLGVNLGYAYTFKDDMPENTVTYVGLTNADGALASYAGLGRKGGHHRFNVGGGLRYTAGRFDIGANYDYYKKADYDAHRVYGTVGVSF